MSGREPDEVEHLALGRGGREAEVAILGEGRVHDGEGDLDEVERPVATVIPGTEGLCDPGPEPGPVGEPERRVVAEPCRGERRQVPVGSTRR